VTRLNWLTLLIHRTPLDPSEEQSNSNQIRTRNRKKGAAHTLDGGGNVRVSEMHSSSRRSKLSLAKFPRTYLILICLICLRVAQKLPATTETPRCSFTFTEDTHDTSK